MGSFFLPLVPLCAAQAPSLGMLTAYCSTVVQARGWGSSDDQNQDCHREQFNPKAVVLAMHRLFKTDFEKHSGLNGLNSHLESAFP